MRENRMAKWKRRASVSDLPTGPKDAHSTVLSIEDEGEDAQPIRGIGEH